MTTRHSIDLRETSVLTPLDEAMARVTTTVTCSCGAAVELAMTALLDEADKARTTLVDQADSLMTGHLQHVRADTLRESERPPVKVGLVTRGYLHTAFDEAGAGVCLTESELRRYAPDLTTAMLDALVTEGRLSRWSNVNTTGMVAYEWVDEAEAVEPITIDPLTVTCPTCEAGSTWQCRSTEGKQRPITTPHPARIAAAQAAGESHATPCTCGHVRGQHSLATPRPCDKCECGSFSPMGRTARR